MKQHADKYKALSEKYGMSERDIEKITNSQFEFTRHIMSKGDDMPIRLQYLGKFQVKPDKRANLKRKREWLKNYHEKRKQEKQREELQRREEASKDSEWEPFSDGHPLDQSFE